MEAAPCVTYALIDLDEHADIDVRYFYPAFVCD